MGRPVKTPVKDTRMPDVKSRYMAMSTWTPRSLRSKGKR